jgi:hypothetical protein
MLRRALKIETTVHVPLQNYHSKKPGHERYQLQRRGKIARLLKPKPKRAHGQPERPEK